MSDCAKKTGWSVWLRWLVILGAVAVFLMVFARFYVSGSGYSALIGFGTYHDERYVPELKALNYYSAKDSYGYDGQWYAQMALRPTLAGDDLQQALDNPAYRARRMLFSWTAALLGAGQDAWVLQAYAVQNVLFWLLLGALLLRVFPPSDWFGVLKWLGVMFSYGLCCSVKQALVDGPSLLLIAAGVMLYEARKPWWSALVLGVSGLGKETNLLAGSVMADWAAIKERRWVQLLGCSLMVIGPLALWIWTLTFIFPATSEAGGARAFAAPFVGYLNKWREVWTVAQAYVGGDRTYVWGSVVCLAALTVQFGYIVLRPQPANVWWRVGFSYAVLMMFLGDAVWEGKLGAAPRVLLPMVLVFNVLIESRARNLPLILLGNCSVLALGGLLVLPAAHPGFEVRGVSSAKGLPEVAEFSAEWFEPERRLVDYWRWSSQTAQIKLLSGSERESVLGLTCEINSPAESFIEVELNGVPIWSGRVGRERQEVSVSNCLVAKGGAVLVFKHAWIDPDAAANPRKGMDGRPMAFRVYNLKFDVR